MNLSPRISAGLNSIASFCTARRRACGKGSADLRGSGSPPATLGWRLGRGSVVLCGSVVPVAAAAARRSQLPFPQHLGVPLAGHFQEDAGGKQPQRRRCCLTPWM